MGGNDELNTGGFFGTTRDGYGNDLLEGGDGEDILSSGGDDRPDGQSSTLLGGNGNDQLFVRPDDLYDGGAGLDSVNGQREDGVPTTEYPLKRVWLDEQSDTLHVNGLDGNNFIRVTLDNSTNPPTFRAESRGNGMAVYNLPLADVKYVVVNGGDDDVIDLGGLPVPATVYGWRGNDSITGGNAADTLLGGDGHDTLRGGAGDDALEDTEGSNVFDGGPGTDTINGVRETPTAETRYEAETARLWGARQRNSNPGYTGAGYADFINSTEDFIEWRVSAAAAGTHTLAFRYAGTSDRPLELRVNGQVVRSRLSFPSTTSFGVWREVTIDVPLTAGSNTVRLTAVGSSGNNIDALTVHPVDQPPPGGDEVFVQAEQTSAPPVGAGVGRSNGGYTGTGYIDFNAGSGAEVRWNVAPLSGPGDYVIEFRYANGSASPRTLSIEAQPGTPARNVAFASTGSWTTWRTLTVPVTLSSGNALSVIARTIGSNGPNIDSLTVRRATTTGPTTLQAEQATLVGARIKAEQSGFQGTGYADYANASGDSVEWTFDHAGGSRTVTFRYANGAASDRPLELRVNGAVINPRLSFAPTGSWSNWREVSVTVQLASGQNKVKLTSIGNNGPNVDLMRIS